MDELDYLAVDLARAKLWIGLEPSCRLSLGLAVDWDRS